MEQNKTTIPEMLRQRARENPDGPAIFAPGREPLSFAALMQQTEEAGTALRAFGLEAGDRVALVLPNGPEAATAFLSIADSMACAPLNPGYRREEFNFYLSDLRARALVVQYGSFPAAVAAARGLGIRVLFIEAVEGGRAGAFRVVSGSPAVASPSTRRMDAGPDDIALLLHTSGTTSRPKLVPLSHRNLATSASNIAVSLDLAPRDRCLNMMPLFHIHGLVGALVSSLVAGGSVICAPGFNGLRFSRWLTDFAPTWYTAVPTMHQAILARAGKHRSASRPTNLRFIRSCSAPLSPRLMAELEECFAVPVVEAYGMTEATHQIACNPLPPRKRKPGSVGLATGTMAAVMDSEGCLLAGSETGEIVIRGASMTAGYDHNPEANEQAFVAGWFRTGDQGYIDTDGYIYLTGRLKEIINRAGEKISPVEIDCVLGDHPAVRQALAFALPHETLGEEVAVAVVLREGARADEVELRAYAAGRLAAFKVPRRIVLLDEIPKGPTGKLQRIGMARVLGLA